MSFSAILIAQWAQDLAHKTGCSFQHHLLSADEQGRHTQNLTLSKGACPKLDLTILPQSDPPRGVRFEWVMTTPREERRGELVFLTDLQNLENLWSQAVSE